MRTHAMQVLQCGCLWQLLVMCTLLEQLTVEVSSDYCVQEWAAHLVMLARSARSHSRAPALRCVEVVRRSPVHLHSLWCVQRNAA